jgi:hypothetical protein
MQTHSTIYFKMRNTWDKTNSIFVFRHVRSEAIMIDTLNEMSFFRWGILAPLECAFSREKHYVDKPHVCNCSIYEYSKNVYVKDSQKRCLKLYLSLLTNMS